ncbi:MAG: hypothetical protein RL318_2832 [Fibrobacterota bacterium]|jgi:DNA-binding transcriptional LysR family regulator
MELYQLRTFVAVAREGNLSRAAKELATSQPAVSAQVKALEEELGLALFERSPKGMALTPGGVQLLEDALAVIGVAEGMLAKARSLRGVVEGIVKIGALSDPAILRLGQILTLSQERHPGLVPELHHATSGNLRRELLAGNLDCAFILGPSEDGLERRDLRAMRLVVVLPPDAGAAVDWDRICQMQWIGTPPGCPLRLSSQALFERKGCAPSRVFQVEIERTIVEMVASGLGAGLLREDTARWAQDRGKCRIWEGDGVETGFALVWRKGQGEMPRVKAVRNLVDAVWGMC